MARLPLIINDQRLKTLEGLRENFNLTELLARFRGGQLRAWLNCWDFSSELEQVEALSPDLPEQELLETLCHIFRVEGDAKEQALAAFRKEREKLEEQQREVERLRKLHEQEEQRKAEQTEPLTLDEIEFDWQEAEGPEIELLISGRDRFSALSSSSLFYYSYDGIHWEKADFHWRGNRIKDLYYCNDLFIFQPNDSDNAYWSSDFNHWNEAKIDLDVETSKIIWTGKEYMALCNVDESYYYKTKTLFITTNEKGWYKRPVVYMASDISGPWHEEKINKYYSGDIFTDAAFFKDNFIFTGCKAPGWYAHTDEKPEQFRYAGSSINDLQANLFGKEQTGYESKIWSGCGKCFRCAVDSCNGFDFAYLTKDGSQWTKIKYGIADLIDGKCFLVARLLSSYASEDASYESTWGHRGQDIGFHISLDGINWRKLNTPLQSGKMAYLDGKLLIADGNKIAVGTLKATYKDNTTSSSPHSSNASIKDRDLHYNVELSAEEAKAGTIKEVTVTRSETCSLCSGSGRESGSGEKNCTNCNGCGLVQRSKSIKVRIPADVKSGGKLRVSGQGNAGRGEAQPGDLYVHITVRDEPSVSPSQTNSVDHTKPLKEITDAMNPLKNPAVLISPTAGIAKAVTNILKNK